MMKLKILLLAVICVVFAGCGDIEWFPDKTNGFGNFTGSTNKPTSPVLTMAYSPKAIFAGYSSSSTLTFTITNSTGNPAQTELGFVDQLPSGLSATVASSQCGGSVAFTESKKIILNGGQLASGTPSCTITAKINGTNGTNDPIVFTNKATDLSMLVGGLTSGVTADHTVKVFPVSVKDSTATLAASRLVATVASTDSNVKTFTFSAEVTNSSDADTNVSIDFEAVDANGETLKDDFLPITGVFSGAVGANETITLVQAGHTVDVPLALANRILFWRITKVTKF